MDDALYFELEGLVHGKGWGVWCRSMGLVQEVGESIGDGAHRVTHFKRRREHRTDTRKRIAKKHLSIAEPPLADIELTL